MTRVAEDKNGGFLISKDLNAGDYTVGLIQSTKN